MPNNRKLGISFLLLTAIGLLVIGGLLLYTSHQRPIVVEVDGEALTIRGRFDSVRQAVESANITLRSEDFISPSLTSAVPADGRIWVRSAQPVDLLVEGHSYRIWTLQDNLASFLAEQAMVLDMTSSVFVDDQPVPWPATMENLKNVNLGQKIEVRTQNDIQIKDGLESTSLLTEATTVGQTLADVGIRIYAADRVAPMLGSWLRPEDQIQVERATSVTVRLGDRVLDVRTSGSTVAAALSELGVGLVGRDEISPGLDEQIGNSDPLTVDRATSTYELVDSVLPYSRQLVPLDTLEIDQRSLVSAGAPGSLSQLTRMETVGSKTISPTVVGSWVSQPPTDELIGYGTEVVVRTVDTPQGPLSYWRVVRMRVTAYTAADAGKPPSHPSYGITASGRPAGYGIVAIDPNVVPFRSQVYVPGYGVAFAGDTGGAVKGRWIDLGYDEGEIETWNGYVDVYYLTPVPEPSRINYLIPSALP